MNSHFQVHEYRKGRDISHLCWKSGESRQVFTSRIFNVDSIHHSREDGRKGDFLRLNCPDWVNVCAITRDSRNRECLVMVRQYRHGNEQIALELPGGMVDSGEASEESARRELLEETGYRAKKILSIGSSNPNAAFMGNTMHVFAAPEIEFAGNRELDHNEVLDVELVPIAMLDRGEVPEFLVNGVMTLAWYYFATWMRRTGRMP